MRLCVPIPCFFKGIPFGEAIAKVAALGYDAAEIYNWAGLDLDSARGACLDNGVELLSILTNEFRMTSPEHREAFVAGVDETG
jgi:sugar phosphate isomerase/epimerase